MIIVILCQNTFLTNIKILPRKRGVGVKILRWSKLAIKSHCNGEELPGQKALRIATIIARKFGASNHNYDHHKNTSKDAPTHNKCRYTVASAAKNVITITHFCISLDLFGSLLLACWFLPCYQTLP